MDLAARCLACLWEFLLLGPQTALRFRKPLGNSCHIVVGNYIKRLDQDTEARFWFWDLNHIPFKGLSLIYHRKRLKPLGSPWITQAWLCLVQAGHFWRPTSAEYALCSLHVTMWGGHEQKTHSFPGQRHLGAGNWRVRLCTPWWLWLSCTRYWLNATAGITPTEQKHLDACP